MRPHLRFIAASSIFVFDQLLREEALLRANNDNWCILVHGSAPAIVMGAFAKPRDVICEEKWKQEPIPIIRRFSGGGTVVVDEGTSFLAWILNAREFAIDPYPQPIMKWVHQQLTFAMAPLELQLCTQDYVLQNGGHLRKIIGNAQSIVRGRFVHHSSLLWNYQPTLMQLLRLPSKQPSYRHNRSHDDFLFTLEKACFKKSDFESQLLKHLQSSFDVEPVDYENLNAYLSLTYRKTCKQEYPFSKANQL